MKTYKVTCYNRHTKKMVAEIVVRAESHADATSQVKEMETYKDCITSTDRI